MERLLIPTRLGVVHVLDWAAPSGAAAGPPLLLLHQTPRSVDEFAEVAPLLARHYRVIAIDTPGYGCSDPVAGQPSVADYAHAALNVLDALGVAVAIPVGHHTGAVIAVELAASAPERIAKVVLSGPVYVDAPGRDQLAAHFHQWRVAQDGSHLTDKWRKFLAWGATPSLAQRIVRDLFRAGETSEQGHFAVAAYPMETRLALVQCGALLLFHAGDAFTDPARAAPLAAAFSPVVTAHTDAGVFAANEAPHAFADAVLAYLSADQDRSR